MNVAKCAVDVSSIQKVICEQLKSFFADNERCNHRLELEIENIDSISWLRCQDHERKLYWQNRERTLAVAGVGIAYEIKASDITTCCRSIYEMDLPFPMRFFGGMRFDTNREKDILWEDLGSVAFFVPRFEVCQENNKTIFAVNIVWERQKSIELYDKIKEELEGLSFSLRHKEVFCETYIERTNCPSQDEWSKQFSSIHREFLANEINKIVLARRSTFEFSSTIDGLCLLQYLADTQNDTYLFYVQWKKNKAFLGATPERLYSRENQIIYSEAVAGTRKRGKTLEDDRELGHNLLTSLKDKAEHQFVVDNINQVLQKICKNYDYASLPVLLKLKNLQHLYTRFEGMLQNNITDSDILQILHPTAAVCGFPKQKNMKKISELETFDRGWFAGPLGWITKNKSDFAVAIRSCVVWQRLIYLFAGAGIVKDSTAIQEWNEIEDKMRNFDCIFG